MANSTPARPGLDNPRSIPPHGCRDPVAPRSSQCVCGDTDGPLGACGDLGDPSKSQPPSQDTTVWYSGIDHSAQRAMTSDTSELKHELALAIPGAGTADVRLTYRGRFELWNIKAKPSKTLIFVGHHLTTEENVNGDPHRKAGEVHKFWLDLPDGTTKRLTATELAQYLPDGVATVYFAGCNSMPFAEDLKRLKPELTV